MYVSAWKTVRRYFAPPPPVDHTHTRTKPPRTPPLRKALSSIYLYTTNVFMACLPLGCRVTAERPPSAPPTTPPPIPARNSIIADKISCVGRVTAGLIYTRPSPKYTSGGWVPNLNAAELRGWTGERGPGLACKLNVHFCFYRERDRRESESERSADVHQGTRHRGRRRTRRRSRLSTVH